MDSTLVDQCRKDHTESRRGHIDLQKSPSSSYRSDKVKQCSVDTARLLVPLTLTPLLGVGVSLCLAEAAVCTVYWDHYTPLTQG